MSNEVLKFAQKVAGQRDWLVSPEYAGGFRPENYEYGMEGHDFGSGYGRAAGSMMSDVMSGGSTFDDPRYGLSAAGVTNYQTLMDDYKQYGVDNADYFVNNRDNPDAIWKRYSEDARERGILPSGEASWGDTAAGAWEGAKELFTGESQGELTEIGDTENFQQNVMSGLKSQIAENPGAFIEGMKAPIMKQYMSNRFSGFGDLLSNMAGDIGKGTGNIFTYLMQLLGKVSPAFTDMLARIKERHAGSDSDSEPVTGGANA